MSKQQLGQFFTTNSDYILQGLESYIFNKEVCDPFAGGKDLINWAIRHQAKSTCGFDIDPNLTDSVVQLGDSLSQNRQYKFVLSNPPYLYVNKISDPTLKQKYFSNTQNTDYYQIALEKILDSEEGILIVPINFLSAQNSQYIRRKFFDKFKIIKANYFTNQVFEDTTYTVIAFYYSTKTNNEEFEFELTILPQKTTTIIQLKKRYDWLLAGDIMEPINNQVNYLGIKRLCEDDIRTGELSLKSCLGNIKNKSTIKVCDQTFQTVKSNILLLKAIDSGSQEGQIILADIRDLDLDCLVSKTTSRNQIYLTFQKPISIDDQLKIIQVFNDRLSSWRDTYHSLFMTNYRDKGRKRISFDFAYKLINHIYFEEIDNQALCWFA